ncbi:hypothetical protein OY671_009089, partial [Metschnikowia pulcherrima]
PVICSSVSSSKVYQRTENQHPVSGVEYSQDEYSSTDEYFKKMGMKVRYFMPPNSAAPSAFYFTGDSSGDYTNLASISTISTMDTFQKISRPEIYNANSAAGKSYQPSSKHQDYSSTRIVYDREERSRSAVEQGKFVEEHFIKPASGLIVKKLLPTSTAGSSPKPSWSAEPETSWSPWKLQDGGSIEGKQDASRSSSQEQQHAGIDIVSDG